MLLARSVACLLRSKRHLYLEDETMRVVPAIGSG